MKQIDNQKIKTYNECTADEKEVLDSFRKMKLMMDHSKFNLYRFQIANLIDDYEQMKLLRESIQMKYFAIYESLVKEGLIEGELDATAWGINREHENDTWAAELKLMDEIKSNFDMAINMIESGEAKRSIIEAENNW